MKKRILALTLSALMLSGCGAQEAPVTVPGTTAVTEAPAETTVEAAVPAGTVSSVPDHRLWDVSSMSYSGYHVSSEYWMGAQDHFTLFLCRDQTGRIIWTKEAPHHNGGAQISPTWPLGIADDKFFYYHDGVVTALELTTGEPLWESADTGICLADTEAAWVDFDGFLCLGDYFGANLAVLDFDGNLIREIPPLDPDLYWISRLTRQGDSLIVHLDGGSYDDLYGTDLTLPIDWIP